MENLVEKVVLGGSGFGVKVTVQMRPLGKEEEGGVIVQKVSNDSLTIDGQSFTFDSVVDAEASQVYIFNLVENCLVGFNISIFAYGEEQIKRAEEQLTY